jgi:hypothetical protein
MLKNYKGNLLKRKIWNLSRMRNHLAGSLKPAGFKLRGLIPHLFLRLFQLPDHHKNHEYTFVTRNHVAQPVKPTESAVTEEWLEKLHTRSRARMDDTARWERWQASGGLARLRALQNVETQPVQKGSSISECDVQSVASIQNRITDLTISSMNPPSLGGTAEEVADLLAESSDVRELISKGFKIMEADRFERNLMRLLKDFAINLRKEATNEVPERCHKTGPFLSGLCDKTC